MPYIGAGGARLDEHGLDQPARGQIPHAALESLPGQHVGHGQPLLEAALPARRAGQRAQRRAGHAALACAQARAAHANRSQLCSMALFTRRAPRLVGKHPRFCRMFELQLYKQTTIITYVLQISGEAEGRAERGRVPAQRWTYGAAGP